MRPAVPVALLAAAAALAACRQQPQQAAQQPKQPSAGQFDLQCEGFTQRVGPNITTAREAHTTHFRVDIDAGLWCRDKCESISKIKKADSRNISFVDTMTRDDQGYPMSGSTVSVNRLTGKLSDLAKEDSITTITDGTCVHQPFSGLPEQKF